MMLGREKMKPFDPSYVVELLPLLLKYLHVTISIAIVSMVLGLILALILAVIRIYRVKILFPLSKLFISYFRGTPLIVQLFLLYYGVPQIIPIFKDLTSYNAAVLGLSLNASAYMAEIIRAAISSVDKGQMEACLSVGMTPWQGMRRIIFPQAARVAVPSLGNTFVDLVKGSSLAFTMGVAEIMAKSQMSAAANYKFFESYLAVSLVYWAIIVFFNHLQKLIENRLNKAY
jgi:putative amino-acid transport system permease protein